MNTLRLPTRLALATLVAASPIASAYAQELVIDDLAVLAADDTIVTLLDDGRLLAESASDTPRVAFEGRPVRIAFVKTERDAAVGGMGVDVLLGGAGDDQLESDDAPTESVSLSFAPVKIVYTSTATKSSFDGRLLTARDLADEPTYQVSQVSSSWDGAAYGYDFYRGGVVVATAELDGDGVAPFVVDALPFEVGADVSESRHGGEWIELHTFTFGSGTTATTDDGRRITFDTLVVRALPPVAAGTHEVGHALGIHHTVERTTVRMTGVDSMVLAVE